LHQAAESRGEVRIVAQTSFVRLLADPHAPSYAESDAGTLGGDSLIAGMERYHQSKLANIAFAMRLHSKLASAGLSTFKSMSAAPGWAGTDLIRFNIPPLIARLLWNYYALSAPDGACPLLTAMFDPSARSGDFYEPEFMGNGPPYKVIDQGVPNRLAEIPRYLCGVRDREFCSEAVGDKVWADTESALGEKFTIREVEPVWVV